MGNNPLCQSDSVKSYPSQNQFVSIMILYGIDNNIADLLLSHLMGKPTICIGENKDADQLRGYTAKLISAFVFATRIVQFPSYLNPKFQASSSFLCLYRLVCVRPVQKPHCWFSHEAALLQVLLGICGQSLKQNEARWT